LGANPYSNWILKDSGWRLKFLLFECWVTIFEEAGGFQKINESEFWVNVKLGIEDFLMV
jgi:hypothetical protein